MGEARAQSGSVSQPASSQPDQSPAIEVEASAASAAPAADIGKASAAAEASAAPAAGPADAGEMMAMVPKSCSPLPARNATEGSRSSGGGREPNTDGWNSESVVSMRRGDGWGFRRLASECWNGVAGNAEVVG